VYDRVSLFVSGSAGKESVIDSISINQITRTMISSSPHIHILTVIYLSIMLVRDGFYTGTRLIL